jgi:hypothetical protein
MQKTRPELFASDKTDALPTLSSLKQALLEPFPEDAKLGELPPLAFVEEVHAESLPSTLRAGAERRAIDPNKHAGLRLQGDEFGLVMACERTTRLGIDHVALMCRVARVSVRDVHLHAREIGVTRGLTDHMIENVRRFAYFMRLLVALCVLRFGVRVGVCVCVWACGRVCACVRVCAGG